MTIELPKPSYDALFGILDDDLQAMMDLASTKLPEWQGRIQAFRAGDFSVPIYNIRIRQTKRSLAIEWTKGFWYTTKTGKERKSAPKGLTIGPGYCYRRIKFPGADDAHWTIIESIENEAGPLRRLINENAWLHRYVRYAVERLDAETTPNHPGKRLGK